MLKALTLVFLLTFAGAAAGEERWQTLPEPAPMPAATRSGYALVNGIQMYYAVFGSGDPVLLIHGGLGHADIWSSEVAVLSKTHMVIVADVARSWSLNAHGRAL